MSYSGAYRLASEDVASEPFGDEFVLLNLATGYYFSVSGAATVFLEGLLAGYGVAEMLGAFGPGSNGRGHEARRFLADMIANDLIEPDDSRDPEPLASDWVERMRAVSDPISLEVFGDLAELITADPIHDTDEARGWPVLRDA